MNGSELLEAILTATLTSIPNASLTAQGNIAPEAWDHTCLNCGAALTGAFCAQCGQRAIPPYPTTRELAGDAFHEISGWDGRFASTIRTLLRHPGMLTREFLNGRRARYISPIRLYLVASLAYFVVAAATPNQRASGTLAEVGGIRFGIFTPPPPGSSAERVSRGVQAANAAEITAAQRDSVLAEVEQAPAFIRPALRRAITDPTGFQRALVTNMPRVLFGLLPVFAAILALFYRRRHYPEHLYFALHLHAFVFVALLFNELVKLTGVSVLAVAAGVAAILWIAVYALSALRRVYGGSWPGTVVKAAGVGVLYLAATIPALFGLVTWAALRG